MHSEKGIALKRLLKGLDNKKEVKEVKKVTSKFMFEVVRGWKAQGMGCAKTQR